MTFELAYDLGIVADREVVFIKSDDWHRKVRLLVTECSREGDTVRFTGHSLGSSYPPIKAAKRDEIPVVVHGEFAMHNGALRGTLTTVA